MQEDFPAVLIRASEKISESGYDNEPTQIRPFQFEDNDAIPVVSTWSENTPIIFVC